MTKAIAHRVSVIAIASLLCCGTVQAQGAAPITFVTDMSRSTALRDSVKRELRRQGQPDPQTPAAAPKKKMKSPGRKAGLVAILIGVGIGVAYLFVVARPD